MGLFDETNVQSEEMAALLKVQTLLSQSAALQTLLKAATEAEAKALILVGPSEPPTDGNTYTINELENRIAWCQLYPQLTENSLLCTWSRAVGATPEKEGFFRLHVRRQILQSDYDIPQGRNDVWKYFLDQSSAMCEEYIAAADLNLRTQQIRREQGPLFNNQATHGAQGIFVFADFLIPWGGSETSE